MTSTPSPKSRDTPTAPTVLAAPTTPTAPTAPTAAGGGAGAGSGSGTSATSVHGSPSPFPLPSASIRAGLAMARTTRNSTVMQGCVQEYLGGSDAPLESLRTAPPMLVASCLAHNLMMDAPPNLQDAGAIDACGLLRKEQALRRITKLMAVLKLPPKAVAMAHLNALCCGAVRSLIKDFTDMQATVRESDAKECTCPTHMCCTAHA